MNSYIKHSIAEEKQNIFSLYGNLEKELDIYEEIDLAKSREWGKPSPFELP